MLAKDFETNKEQLTKEEMAEAHGLVFYKNVEKFLNHENLYLSSRQASAGLFAAATLRRCIGDTHVLLEQAIARGANVYALDEIGNMPLLYTIDTFLDHSCPAKSVHYLLNRMSLESLVHPSLGKETEKETILYRLYVLSRQPNVTQILNEWETTLPLVKKCIDEFARLRAKMMTDAGGRRIPYDKHALSLEALKNVRMQENYSDLSDAAPTYTPAAQLAVATSSTPNTPAAPPIVADRQSARPI